MFMTAAAVTMKKAFPLFSFITHSVSDVIHLVFERFFEACWCQKSLEEHVVLQLKSQQKVKVTFGVMMLKVINIKFSFLASSSSSVRSPNQIWNKTGTKQLRCCQFTFYLLSSHSPLQATESDIAHIFEKH